MSNTKQPDVDYPIPVEYERVDSVIDAEYIEANKSIATERQAPVLRRQSNRKGPISDMPLRA